MCVEWKVQSIEAKKGSLWDSTGDNFIPKDPNLKACELAF